MANKKDSLGDRMKNNYEVRSRTALMRRCPVIIRIDGKAFHTFTKGFNRPYDKVMHDSMNDTLKYLCENIQGCKFGYTQSDEISLLLTDFDTLATDAWFDYEVQKMCSIAASMATLQFNKAFRTHANQECAGKKMDEYQMTLCLARDKGALFDARAYNIPEDEVVNYFIWRQQDATRNAIQMLGQTYFSHKQLDKKTCNMIQDMLFQEHGVNFNNMEDCFKRGVGCYREIYETDNSVKRSRWVIDEHIPIFSKDRNYIKFEKEYK